MRHSPLDDPNANILMAFLKGYFDESGKHQRSDVVSFCGFVESDWEPFQNEWNYLLRRNKISSLHIGKDALKADAARIKMYAQFVQAIKKTVAQGFAMVVDVAAFKNMSAVVRKEYRDDSHFLAFSSVVRDVVRYANVLPDPSVAIICDDEPSKACECYKMFDVMRQNSEQPESRKTLRSIAFADAGFYTQLQAADLFAYICRAESRYRFFGEDLPQRVLFKEFQMDAPEFRTTFKTGMWDAAILQEYDAGCLVEIESRKNKKADRRRKG